MAALEETGSWWRGLVPTRVADIHSISWQAVFLGFWGAVGFAVNGAGMYAYTFRWATSEDALVAAAAAAVGGGWGREGALLRVHEVRCSAATALPNSQPRLLTC